MDKQLYRIKEGSLVSGVCTGFGEYFGIDPVFFRILFILLALSNGVGIILYIILIFIIPKKEKGIKEAKKVHILEKHSSENFGILLVCIGIFFAIQMAFTMFGIVFHHGFFLSWPVLLIFVGAFLFFQAKKKNGN